MSKLNTKVRRRNFLKSYQEHLLESGHHLPTNIGHKSVCSATHLQHEIEDNRLQSSKKNSIHFKRNRLRGVSSVQDFGEYSHHETEDSRLPPLGKNILSSIHSIREKLETEDNKLHSMKKNTLSSKHFRREMFETEDNRPQLMKKNTLSSRHFSREKLETEDNRLQSMKKNTLSSDTLAEKGLKLKITNCS